MKFTLIQLLKHTRTLSATELIARYPQSSPAVLLLQVRRSSSNTFAVALNRVQRRFARMMENTEFFAVVLLESLFRL